jgi:MOSC domain-containing protein YiiM
MGVEVTRAMVRKPIIHAVFVGQPKSITDEGGTWTSSIYRDRVEGPVSLQQEGLVGDKSAQPDHGGPDNALCVHLLDHYRFWDETYDVSLSPGSVGENLTLSGIGEDQVCVGDIVRVGSGLAQVSGPRVPCANQARRVGRSDWVKLTIRENRTGFMMRVLEPGIVAAGDSWEVRERPNPDGSIPAINRCIYLDFDPVYAARIIEMAGLAEWWKEQMTEKLGKVKEHWTATMKD